MTATPQGLYRLAVVPCPVLPVAVAWLVFGVPALAGDLTELKLEPQGDGYYLEARGWIEAPRDAVWQVLTDYDDLYRVSPRIIESDLVSVSADGVYRVRTLNRLCFLAFCRDLRHLQLIRELGDGVFESHSVAAESDLSRGYAQWRLRDYGKATLLEIEFSFAMDSYAWVPSFLSRFIVRSALEADARALISGIERTVRLRTVPVGED